MMLTSELAYNKNLMKQHYKLDVKTDPGTDLGANEQVGDTGCILLQLRHPFLSHILETGRVDHREADEEDIGHWVGQWSQAVIVLLE